MSITMSKKEKIKHYLMVTRIKRAISARVISIVVTSFIGWIITGDPLIGLSIGSADAIIKIFIYYTHETLWEKKMTKEIKKIKVDN